MNKLPSAFLGVATKRGEVFFDDERIYTSHQHIISSMNLKQTETTRLVLMSDTRDIKTIFLDINPPIVLYESLGKDEFLKLMKEIVKNSENEIMKKNLPFPNRIYFEFNSIYNIRDFVKKYSIDCEYDKFISLLKGKLEQLENDKEIFEDVFYKFMKETKTVQDYYYYWGWITPDLRFILPSKEEVNSHNMAHIVLLKKYTEYESESDALKNGYLKVIGEKTFLRNDDIITFDFSFEYAKKIGIEKFSYYIKDAIKLLINHIVTEKLNDIFDHEIPIPSKLLLYDEYISVSIKIDNPNTIPNQIQRMLSAINEKIIYRNGKYFLYSKDGKRKLGGPYKRKKDAIKRERQVQYFKHLHK